MKRYILVEVRIGTENNIPSVADWAAYRQIRDHIGSKAENRSGGSAEVGQMLELTDNGIVERFRAR